MATFFNVLNVLTVLLGFALAFLIFFRRLQRELPWFTAYILYLSTYTLVFSVVFYWLRVFRNPMVLWYGYLIGTSLTLGLAFMVIMEVFRNSAGEHHSIRKIGVRLLVVIAIIAILVAVLMAPYGSDYETARVVARIYQVLQRSIRVVQVALLIGIFVLSSYIGLSWRNYNFGIALGYGLYASVNLACTAAQGYFGPRKAKLGYNYVTAVDGVAYELTLILWMVYLWRSDRGQPNQLPPPGSDKDLGDWNDALKPLAK